jgi:hydrogenase 3 maturation protease
MSLVIDLMGVVKDKTCIIGMGNYLRKDDAVGLYLIDQLRSTIRSEDVLLMNVEDVIENYVFKIAELDCDNVLIIDAVKATTTPGSIVFGRLNRFDDSLGDCSTHTLSLTLCGKILEESGKKTYLLGIEAADTDFGRGLSEDVQRSADILMEVLIDTITTSQHEEYIYKQ